MNISWNAEDYNKNFDFVYNYGNDVIALLKAKAGSLVVDVGCGSGALTERLRLKGYRVIGVDASEEMLCTAKKKLS